MERLQIEGVPPRLIEWLNVVNAKKNPDGEKVWERFFWLMTCNGGPIIRKTCEAAAAVGPFKDGIDMDESIELSQMTAFANGIMWAHAEDVWNLIQVAVEKYAADEKERYEREAKPD